MKKLLLIFIIFISLYSCDKNAGRTTSKDLEREMKVDSIINKSKKEFSKKMYADSTGMETSPVLVTKSKIVEKEYSNYRDLYLKYKNISNKTIEGVKFEWYGEDVFGEPADMGSGFLEGWGNGFVDEKIKPNQSNDGTYSILSRDAKKIKMIRAYEVVFSDGTFWKLEDYKKEK